MTHEQAHAEHMERVRAVHRRSSYERVLSKIAFYEWWDRAVTEGIKLGRKGPDDPPLAEHDRETLRYLYELRDALRREMIDAGQIAADA